MEKLNVSGSGVGVGKKSAATGANKVVAVCGRTTRRHCAGPVATEQGDFPQVNVSVTSAITNSASDFSERVDTRIRDCPTSSSSQQFTSSSPRRSRGAVVAASTTVTTLSVPTRPDLLITTSSTRSSESSWSTETVKPAVDITPTTRKNPRRGRDRVSSPLVDTSSASESVTTSTAVSLVKDVTSSSAGGVSEPTAGKDACESGDKKSARGGGRRECVVGGEGRQSTRARSSQKVMTEKPKLAPMLLMNNLPYMGELTFDTRPRRGRKPKKADICHLISKNYGIQFPNSYTNFPNTGQFHNVPAYPSLGVSSASASPKKVAKKTTAKKSSGWKKSTETNGEDNKCALPPDLVPLSGSNTRSHTSSRSSLRNSANGNVQSDPWSRSSTTAKTDNFCRMYNGGTEGEVTLSPVNMEEPLNLCLRDSPSVAFPSPSPPASPQRTSLSPAACQPFKPKTFRLPSEDAIIRAQNNKSRGSKANSNFVDSAQDIKRTRDGHLVNNVNITKGGTSGGNANSSLNLLSQSPTAAAPVATATKKTSNRRKRSVVFTPQTPPLTSKFSAASSTAATDSKGTADKSKGPETTPSLFGQTNSGSRAEVSICKFKFTGGAKPSLQEKKMLSVDSGGNFRFYTDKATPSASKCFRASVSSSSARSDFDQDFQYPLSSLPKSAKSMSMCMPAPVTSMTSLSISKGGTLSSVCTLPRLSATTSAASSSRVSSTSFTSPPSSTSQQTGPAKGKGKTSATSLIVPKSESSPIDSRKLTEEYSATSSSENTDSNSQGGFSEMLAGSGAGTALSSSETPCGTAAGRLRSPNLNKLKMKRKRRTRKSLMREKLEKTFKEKGFLIQTQQLESAEGATYCKFRQLRKFTRYLFRSWKDYLPDNVKDINNRSAALQQQQQQSSPTGSQLETHVTGTGNETVGSTQGKSSKTSRGKPKVDLMDLGGEGEGKADGEECDTEEDDDDEEEEEEEEEDRSSTYFQNNSQSDEDVDVDMDSEGRTHTSPTFTDIDNDVDYDESGDSDNVDDT